MTQTDTLNTEDHTHSMLFIYQFIKIRLVETKSKLFFNKDNKWNRSPQACFYLIRQDMHFY